MASEGAGGAARAHSGLWLLGTGPGAVEIDAPAERMISQSIDWFAARGGIQAAADAAMVLGELADRRGTLDEAERYYERARTLSQAHADGREVAALECNALGELRMKRKEYEDAERFFAAASEISS